MRLLLAEDDRDISKALATIFEKNNYCTDAVYNGEDAYLYASSENYDGIILDIMMPGMDGLTVLSKLRIEGRTTPVLMLTAKGELGDRVAGLDAGADDYLPKPFAATELLARVRAMLRRRNDFHPDVITFHKLTLNKGTYEIEYNSESARLVSREYQVFEILMDNAGKIIATDGLMEQIWGWDSEVDVSIVWVTISNIRKKLIAIGAPVEIRAVRGVGYCIEAVK